MNAELPTLYVCHGDEGGPRVHPCRRAQEAMHAKGIGYDKVIAVITHSRAILAWIDSQPAA